MILPAILQPYAKRKVRVVARYGDAECAALAALLRPGKKHWGLDGWLADLEEIDDCEMTIEDWTASLQGSTVDPCS